MRRAILSAAGLFHLRLGWQVVSTSLPSRRLPVECAFSPDGLFEARFRLRNAPNLREGEQLRQVFMLRVVKP